jgi:hypothetical protein
MSEQWATADRGAWVAHEKHAFRIGNEIPDSVEFRAKRDEFPHQLADAIIEHAAHNSPLKFYNIQVLTLAGWRNIQNPATGGVMAVTHQIAGERESCVTIFDWACNAVQMVRDLDELSAKIASESVE